ncbi:hypothetical protein [Streptomyces parvus]|uniref:hypothetical protein n=1 Tax=Streptomyces parvus TaxID=66428 RepID=UPI001EF36DD8|nr:hypothetical protein [Streptomyces parvus]
MAADVLQRDFTQIHNRLFRDKRLSFKAKGIFGLISTHRNGYGVTPEWIAAASTDGPAAVRTGLRELEKYGYLVRRQDRKPDGTMGQMSYSITDMPSSEPVSENLQPDVTCEEAESRRSEPVSDYPHADEPLAVDRGHKKTSTKKTRDENTNRPSLSAGALGNGSGGTDGIEEVDRSPGVELLLAVGAEKPTFLLTGKTLRDQGLTVTGMLLEGWTGQQLRQVVAGRPLPDEVKTTVGAIVARRLRDAIAGGPPSSAPKLPSQATERRTEGPATPSPAQWVDQSIVDAQRVSQECVGDDGFCGRPVRPGSPYCWPCSAIYGVNGSHDTYA